MEFKDKVALITGASSGIGRQLALDLAARGAIVAGCGRSEERLAETRQLMAPQSPSSDVFVCDVGDRARVKEMVGKILARFGRIDIVINNAGFGHYQALADLSVDAVERILRTNFLGAVYCTKEVLPSMIERRSGHIVNISSVSGKIGTANMSAYCASKFAMNGFSESLFHELDPMGIHVSLICPGPVRTDFGLLYDRGAPKAPKFVVLESGQVSAAVLRAIEKKQFEVVLPRPLAFACWIKAVTPNLFRLAADRALRARRPEESAERKPSRGQRRP